MVLTKYICIVKVNQVIKLFSTGTKIVPVGFENIDVVNFAALLKSRFCL